MVIRNGVFVVTGGGSGLGLAVVSMLVAQGAKVVAADLSFRAADESTEEVLDNFMVMRVPCDITSTEDVQRTLDFSLALGPVRGVVHCAGVVHGERTLGREGPHDLESFERVVRINLTGTFNVVRLSAAAMATMEPQADGERGVIVATSSIAAWDGQAGQAAYAASKGGVAALALPLARDLARHGIRFVAIAPGIFETPMMSGMTATVRDSLAAQVPFPPRLGHPEEFASLVREAITNPMLNGTTIRLDGAMRMAAK